MKFNQTISEVEAKSIKVTFLLLMTTWAILMLFLDSIPALTLAYVSGLLVHNFLITNHKKYYFYAIQISLGIGLLAAATPLLEEGETSTQFLNMVEVMPTVFAVSATFLLLILNLKESTPTLDYITLIIITFSLTYISFELNLEMVVKLTFMLLSLVVIFLSCFKIQLPKLIKSILAILSSSIIFGFTLINIQYLISLDSELNSLFSVESIIGITNYFIFGMSIIYGLSALSYLLFYLPGIETLKEYKAKLKHLNQLNSGRFDDLNYGLLFTIPTGLVLFILYYINYKTEILNMYSAVWAAIFILPLIVNKIYNFKDLQK